MNEIKLHIPLLGSNSCLGTISQHLLDFQSEDFTDILIGTQLNEGVFKLTYDRFVDEKVLREEILWCHNNNVTLVKSSPARMMTGQSIVRKNMLQDKSYRPYCGKDNYDCEYDMPRTNWSERLKQFTCRCGWISNFPEEFIKEYLAKHSK